MNIPNALTLFRFFLIPFFAALFPKKPYFALTVFIIAWATDLLDGYLARKLDCETKFGRWADPLADKMMVLMALWCFADSQIIPWFFFQAYMIIGILLGIGVVIVYIRDKGNIHRAELFGKVAMGTTLAGIVSLFFAQAIDPWHIVAMAFAAAVSLAAIPYYGFRFLLSKAKSRSGDKKKPPLR